MQIPIKQTELGGVAYKQHKATQNMGLAGTQNPDHNVLTELYK